MLIRNKITDNSPQNNSETDSQIEEKSIEIPKIFIHISRNKTAIMEYQKVINLLDKTPNQQSKFRTKN